MRITVNGEPHEADADARLADLIKDLDLGDKRFAVEVNGELIPKSRHQEHPLRAADKVEVVQAIGGG